MRAESERLLSEKTDSPQNHAEELETLLSTVTSLTEERDQLQEILGGVKRGEEPAQARTGGECGDGELKLNIL